MTTRAATVGESTSILFPLSVAIILGACAEPQVLPDGGNAAAGGGASTGGGGTVTGGAGAATGGGGGVMGGGGGATGGGGAATGGGGGVMGGGGGATGGGGTVTGGGGAATGGGGGGATGGGGGAGPTPSGTISINFGASTTNSPKVMLVLAGTDDVAITHYYASENATNPTPATAGWRPIIPTANYVGQPFLLLSSGNGPHTVNVWFRDAANNISPKASDSIDLRRDDSWRHFFVVFTGNLDDDARYAQQMGYTGIMVRQGGLDLLSRYRTSPYLAGLKFYLSEPDHYRNPVLRGHNIIVSSSSPPIAERDFYNQNMVWRSATAAFPTNLASIWFTDVPCTNDRFIVAWDLQRADIISHITTQFIHLAEQLENTGPGVDAPFTFGGYMNDEPSLNGGFNVSDTSASNCNRASSLAEQTGTMTNSGIPHPGAPPYEYPTYDAAKAAMYKELNRKMKNRWPDAKWVVNPWVLYGRNSPWEWLYQISNRIDRYELSPDMLFQEKGGTDFLDLFADANAAPVLADLGVKPDSVGSTQPNRGSDQDEGPQRAYAAQIAAAGAWYSWFNRFTNANGLPFSRITDVYPRLKLIRVIPNWDNLNNIPIQASNRVWDRSGLPPKNTYDSYDMNMERQSRISASLLYSRHWKRPTKLFAVFINNSEPIRLKLGEVPVDFRRVNEFFEETGSSTAGDFTTSTVGGRVELRLNSSTAVPEGVGYIITLSP